MSQLNEAVSEIRAVIARVGERDQLNWWPSTLYSSGNAVLSRLFPHTASQASYTLVSSAIRQRDGTRDPQNHLLSLFFLGGNRELILSQQNVTPPHHLLDAQLSNGAQVANLLLTHFEAVFGAKSAYLTAPMEVNPVQNRVDVDVLAHSEIDAERITKTVGLLIAGLQFSERNAFIPPVARVV